MSHLVSYFFFFFNDTATTEIYTLSLHDALPIFQRFSALMQHRRFVIAKDGVAASAAALRQELWRWRLGLPLGAVPPRGRSEEHTAELPSPCNIVCRLLLEKKKKKRNQLY